MPALESISIKGFKSIREVEVKLRDINVLIGANGSGKSNFLDVFSFLQTIHSFNSNLDLEGEVLRHYVARGGGAEKLLHFGSKTSEKVDIRIHFQGFSDYYRITLNATDPDTLSIGRMDYHALSPLSAEPLPDEQLQPYDYGGGEGIGLADAGLMDDFYFRLLSRWRLYHFHDTSRSAPIKKTANLHDNRFLRADGSNLAAFLYLLREKHEDSYRFLRNTVRLVAPFFDDFVLEPLALNEDTIRLEWKHVGTDAYFDVSSLSDGTLRFIALATLCCSSRWNCAHP